VSELATGSCLHLLGALGAVGSRTARGSDHAMKQVEQLAMERSALKIVEENAVRPPCISTQGRGQGAT
jgi:hypothetical protein